MKHMYMSAEERKSLIFQMTLIVAKKRGIFKFTLGDVASESRCSKATIKHYYGGIVNLRRVIVTYGHVHNVKWIKETSITEILK